MDAEPPGARDEGVLWTAQPITGRVRDTPVPATAFLRASHGAGTNFGPGRHREISQSLNGDI